MCVKCITPGTKEYVAYREYMASIGSEITDEQILKRTGKMTSGLDFVEDEYFTPETDFLPDGVHIKNRKNWSKVAGPQEEPEPEEPEETKKRLVRNYCNRLVREYNKLPEDSRPDYVDWALSQPSSRQMIVEQMLTDALASPKPEQRTRAQSQVLEFSKVKPKKASELSDTRALASGELPDIIRAVCKLAGVPEDAVEDFIRRYFGNNPQSN